MWTKSFWKGLGERALKTFLQTFVAVATLRVGAEAVGVSAGIMDVPWVDALSVALLATIFSAATSIGNSDFTAGLDKQVVQVVEPVQEVDLVDPHIPTDV